MRHVDLCTGIGGFALAALWGGYTTVQMVEIDPWCQKLLKLRFPGIPIHDDIKTYEGTEHAGRTFLLTAGYPCQGESDAGERKGMEDERWLGDEVLRLVDIIGPQWCIFENVAGHIKRSFDYMVSQMENKNYTCWPFVIPASAVKAPHRRDRIWIVAHSNSERYLHGQLKEQSAEGRLDAFSNISTACANVADPMQPRLERRTKTIRQKKGWNKNSRHNRACAGSTRRNGQWDAEPAICRVANGISERVDRLKGLGNAVVPQIPFLIMETIKQYELTTQPQPETI